MSGLREPGLLQPLRRAGAAVHRRATGPGCERGTSLTELVVGMVLMGICGAIFSGAMISLSRANNQTQAITDATSQDNRAFQLLDRTVRYASAISTPDKGTGGDWYVELRNTTSGSEQCTQLRVATAAQQLQSRSWTAGNLSTLTPWVPVASGITNGAAAARSDTQPFTLPTQSATAVRQRLAFVLVATSGPTSQRVSTRSAFTLTAINSAQSTTGSICQQAGRP